MENAQGAPNHNIDNGGSGLIHKVYAAALLTFFYTATVFMAIANNKYEGDIKKQGDSVVVRTLPVIEIFDYETGQNFQTQEDTSSEPIIMPIDRAKSYNIPLDDITQVQSSIKGLANEWAVHASESMAIEIDKIVLSEIILDVASFNQGDEAGKIQKNMNFGKVGAPLGITKDNIIDYIVEAGVALDESNTPKTDRWMVLPAWAEGLIKQSPLKDASLTGDTTSPLRNGRVGVIDNFTIYCSNNVSYADESGENAFSCPFGSKEALSFATQMTYSDTKKPSNRPCVLIQGLQVFGFKVIRPESLGVLYMQKGAVA